jgi:hypothetical protein
MSANLSFGDSIRLTRPYRAPGRQVYPVGARGVVGRLDGRLVILLAAAHMPPVFVEIARVHCERVEVKIHD